MMASTALATSSLDPPPFFSDATASPAALHLATSASGTALDDAGAAAAAGAPGATRA